jgi:hypothetical protein
MGQPHGLFFFQKEKKAPLGLERLSSHCREEPRQASTCVEILKLLCFALPSLSHLCNSLLSSFPDEYAYSYSVPQLSHNLYVDKYPGFLS